MKERMHLLFMLCLLAMEDITPELDYAYEGLHENTTTRNAEPPITRKNINARIGWSNDDLGLCLLY